MFCDYLSLYFITFLKRTIEISWDGLFNWINTEDYLKGTVPRNGGWDKPMELVVQIRRILPLLGFYFTDCGNSRRGDR
jgi:hypothetical protein